MQGYFLIFDKNFLNPNSGIGKKILKQIEIFNYYNLNCQEMVFDTGREKYPKWVGRILYALPFSNISPKWEYNKNIEKVNFIYLRRPDVMTFKMRKFLKKCKDSNENLKIFMEIPTYPYDSEYRGFFKKYLLLKDKYNRKRLKGLIDYIFVSDPMNYANNLFGIDTCRFTNGYDVLNTKVKKNVEHDFINLTCVGMFNFWHGYERLFYGLKSYIESGKKVRFHINMVGEGVELENYKKIVCNNKLEQYVTFYGKQFGEKLDNIYNITDIGIACLGCYKKNINIIGDLKTREYISKGIPVVSGCKVDLFSVEKPPFYIEIENNASPVDFNVLLEFYNKILDIRKSNNELEQTMHSYAIKNFDIRETMKPIIKVIKDNCV